MDAARKWTDEQIEALEKRMAEAYRQAAREMKAKQEKFMADYQRERSQRLKALDDTPEAKDAYKRWLQSQAARADWMTTMAGQLAEEAARANERAMEAAKGALPGIYAENANRAAYSIDKAAKVDTMFTLVDESTVDLLLRDEPDLLPKPTVKRAKDVRWNKQKFTSAITQGVLQGESVPDIAKRLQSVVDMNRRSAVSAARTAVTGAENAGRVSSYERAKALGIGLKQEWLATLDGRTRDSHRALDGEQVEVGRKFSNGCRFPGDPNGPANEVWNCRCTLIAAVEGVDTSDARRWSKLPDGMTYEEWKAARIPSSSEKMARNQYVAQWPEKIEPLEEQQRKGVVERARKKGIKLEGTREEGFDVDAVNLLVDAASRSLDKLPELKSAFTGRRPFVLRLEHLDDKTLGEVFSSKPNVLCVNIGSTRSEESLLVEYGKAAADGYYAVTRPEGIIYHEVGHMFVDLLDVDPQLAVLDALQIEYKTIPKHVGGRNVGYTVHIEPEEFERLVEIVDTSISTYASEALQEELLWGEVIAEAFALYLDANNGIIPGEITKMVRRRAK